MPIDTGGPAFARPASENTARGTCSGGNRPEHASDGMTLLDWLAGQALAGMLASELIYGSFAQLSKREGRPSESLVAEAAYDFAKNMIAEKRRREAL